MSIPKEIRDKIKAKNVSPCSGDWNCERVKTAKSFELTSLKESLKEMTLSMANKFQEKDKEIKTLREIRDAHSSIILSDQEEIERLATLIKKAFHLDLTQISFEQFCKENSLEACAAHSSIIL
jgi:hypothetical protein